MYRTFFSLAVVCLATAAPTSAPAPPTIAPLKSCLSSIRVEAAKNHIRNYMSQPDTSIADFAGGVVRLAFHDAATWSEAAKNGGPDGYIDLGDHDNFGLEGIIDELEALRLPFRSDMSKADFWALTANTVVEYTQVNKRGAQISIDFKYGRKDAVNQTAQKNIDAGRLPQAKKGWDHVKQEFERMGFTAYEALVLMGAHTLGRAELKNSGFVGPWVLSSSVETFDSGYYINMLTTIWKKKANQQNNMQWNFDSDIPGPSKAMFLNTDMALLFTNSDAATCVKVKIDCNSNPPKKDPQRTSPECILNTEVDLTQACAFQKETGWYPAFAAAFAKMQNLGHANLKSPSTCPGDMDGTTSLLQLEEKEKVEFYVNGTNIPARCVAVAEDSPDVSAHNIMMGRGEVKTTDSSNFQDALYATPVQFSAKIGTGITFDFSGKVGQKDSSKYKVYCATWSRSSWKKLSVDSGTITTASEVYEKWDKARMEANDSANTGFIVTFIVLCVTGVLWVIRGMCTKKPLDPEQVEKMLAANSDQPATEMADVR